MRQFINDGEKKLFDITDETIDGLLFRFDILAANAMTKSELANVRLTLYTTQDGVKQVRITPENFRLSHLYDIIFANDSERGVAILETKQITDVSPDGFYVLPFKFGTPLNLTKGRGLQVVLENGGSVANAGDKFNVEVVTSQAIGVQKYIPVIEQVLLDSNQLEHDEKFGNNIFSILSSDLSDLERVQVISDKVNYEADETYVRSQIFDKAVVEDSGEPTYPLFLVNSGVTPLNGVRLKLEFSTQKARTLYVVKKVTTPAIFTNLIKKTEEHKAEQIADIGKNMLDRG